MHLIHIAMVGMAWLLAVVWLGKLIEAARGLALVPKLWAAKYDIVPVGEPSIVVVVPARNEGPHVTACLNSLVAQDYGNLRVIAVDDRSTDETGAMMDALAAESNGRLRALHVKSLPPDWLGKTHAMAMAAQGVIGEFSPDYLLFTDADVVFEAEAVRRSLVYAVSSGADHLVVVPTTETKTWGERMMLSYLQVMSLWAVRWWKVPDPRAKRDAIGVGAFNLVRTAAYLQLGGFESVRMEILEDLTFGRRVKAAGLRQRVAMAPGALGSGRAGDHPGHDQECVRGIPFPDCNAARCGHRNAATVCGAGGPAGI
jgi:cellulose synthase/poly-beta-1,6-N-acetylglucosamine synthase-like glycosyltransferase